VELQNLLNKIPTDKKCLLYHRSLSSYLIVWGIVVSLTIVEQNTLLD